MLILLPTPKTIPKNVPTTDPTRVPRVQPPIVPRIPPQNVLMVFIVIESSISHADEKWLSIFVNMNVFVLFRHSS